MTTPIKFFATAPKGVASVLFDELRELGAEQLREQPAGVEFEGDMALAYRACLWSRTASRILMPLATFTAQTPEALYDEVQRIDWREHLDTERTLAVDFTTRSSAISHSAYGARKVKDAVVDQFRDRCGERPSVDVECPDVRINVHLLRDEATVSIDLSGDSLHKRGYRVQSVTAPLKENLAAALLLRSGWPGVAAEGGCFVDPMCGSATFPIEAALIAADIAPGLLRQQFGFTGWKQHQAELWASLREEAQQRREQGLASMPPVFGYDLDAKNIRAAQENVSAAGLEAYIRIKRQDVAELTAPEACGSGLVAVNPPYGERLGELEALGGLYALLGSRLKHHFEGWQAAVFTGNPDLSKQMGIRARRLHAFYNGALECKLLRFELEQAFFIEGKPGVPRPARAEDLGPGAEMLANRLRKNLKELSKWARREAVHCYRLYDADLPEYALAVDIYDGDKRWVHVQEYQAPKSVDERKARKRLREALAVIPTVLEIPQDQLFFKVRKKQKGSAQYEKLSEENRFHQVEENGCKFWVNFEDYLDTGLFLDHRKTRAHVAKLAKGKRFLNLFAYTGTVTVYAALAGAESTMTVDMSKTYLDWGKRNLQLNGIAANKHTYVQADCLQWLEEQAKAQGAWQQRFGVIFLDPPTFSTSKRMKESFDVQRDHARLIEQAVTLLEKNGVLVFSNNNKKFRMDQSVLDAFDVKNITRKTIPKDFARHASIHNCWEIRRR